MTVLRAWPRAASVGALLVSALVALPAGGAAAADQLDQNQSVADSFSIGFGGSGPNDLTVAQTFTAGVSGALTKVELNLSRVSAMTAPLLVEIRTIDGSGVPTATVLASGEAAVGSIPVAFSPGAFVPASFAAPAQVAAGTGYAIVARTTGAPEQYRAHGSATDLYSGGGAWFQFPAEAFGPFASKDFAFKTVVDVAPKYDVACDADGVRAGFNVIKGTDGNDVLNGTAGADLIYGFGGNDVIKGRGGADLICAGSGDDIVIGGDGRDVVYADTGNDRVNGNDGNDRVRGGDGNDLLIGKNGRDAMSGENGDDRLRGNKGADTLNGNAGNDVLRGGDGDDDLNGGPGTNDIKQ